MNYYIDITLIPDAEASLGFIWQKVYQQIHLALVENKTSENTSEVALSFPEYGKTGFPLGNKLRLLATDKSKLEALNLKQWLTRLMDYTHVKSIDLVPEGIEQYAAFKRVQFDGNPERLARRRAKRHNISYEEAIKYFEGYETEKTKFPYIQVKSLSKDKQFRLFILQETVDAPQEGNFSCYGLGQKQTEEASPTVPVF